MGCSLHSWLESHNLDLDDLLSYSTVKTVNVRDYRLGLLYRLFQVAIFIYIVVYSIVIQKGYLAKEQVQAGSVTLNMQEPSDAFRKSAAELPYCCLSTDNQTACLEERRYPCFFWDEHLAEFPVGKDYSAVMTSRVSVTHEVAVSSGTDACNLDSFPESCRYQEVGNETKAYIANMEAFTMRIRHGIAGQNVKNKGVNVGPNAIRGSLVASDGTVLRTWPEAEPFQNVSFLVQNSDRQGDLVQLSELLRAAGDVDMDAVSTATGDTLRYDGLNVLVFVDYQTEGTSSLTYEYQPTTLSRAEFKVEQPLILNNGERRDILNRHGVRFIFVQTGELGKFDFLSLLITLVSGVALLAVASTITTLIMTKLLKLRDIYTYHTQARTEDFSYWRAMDEKELDRHIELAKKLNSRGVLSAVEEIDIDTPKLQPKNGTELELKPLDGEVDVDGTDTHSTSGANGNGAGSKGRMQDYTEV